MLFWLVVAGALGAVSRFLLSDFLANMLALPAKLLWSATLAVNLLGSLLLGMVYGLSTAGKLSEYWKQILGTGFVGSFTTFSAISLEIYILLKEKNYGMTIFYILFSIIGSFLCFELGEQLF